MSCLKFGSDRLIYLWMKAKRHASESVSRWKTFMNGPRIVTAVLRSRKPSRSCSAEMGSHV